MKKQKIVGKDWDWLIILDTCRYDYFRNFYFKYLKGNLKKRRSRGKNTLEWLSKTFKGKYNYIYVSGNAYVNSLGIPLGRLYKYKKEYKFNPNWSAKEHFQEIIDVWDKYWDKTKGTVTPENMNKAVRDNLEKLKNTPTIIHYVQPHLPYLNSPIKGLGSKKRRIIKKNNKANRSGEIGLFSKILKSLWKVTPLTIKSNILSKYYKENLELVLEGVKKLVSKKLNGKIIITADHGEALGNRGKLFHDANKKLPSLITVPWLEIEG